MNTIKRISAAILRNEDPYDHLPWISACDLYKEQIVYQVIDITTANWLQVIKNFSPDILLIKVSGKTSLFRALYQERLDILVNDLNYKSCPSFNETRIYENKRFFSYWAQANNIPCPQTWVFYNKNEATDYTKKINYPIVGKMNIGASGKGINILKTKFDLDNYINKAFDEGLTSKTGPKLKTGNIIKRIYKKLINPNALLNKLKTYRDIANDRQIGFVILQEFIPHNFEWRVVRIGDSFFAHKKLKVGDKASGTLLKDYGNPPLKLLDFVKELTEKFAYYSVAVDIFENSNEEYIINEIQCIFGQSDPYQMLVDGKPGRYRHINNNWLFENGDFASNACYDLRLDYVLSQMLK